MLKRILVALDESDLSEQVMGMLQHFQLNPDVTVILAHVVVNLGSNPDIAVDRPQADTEPTSYHQLAKLRLYQAGLPCKSELEIVTGEPAEEIVRLANIHQTDLIIMGSRGLTGMKRILQGSVSSQVIESAPCSVTVVKLKD